MKIALILTIFVINCWTYKNFESPSTLVSSQIQINQNTQVIIDKNSYSDYKYFEIFREFLYIKKVSDETIINYQNKLIEKGIITCKNSNDCKETEFILTHDIGITYPSNLRKFFSTFTLQIIPYQLIENHKISLEVQVKGNYKLTKRTTYKTKIYHSIWFLLLPFFFSIEKSKNDIFVYNALILIDEYNKEIRGK